MKKPLLIAIGSLSLGLGVLGIFLPLLPTVPFLLLTASCYLRSSERLYRWLVAHRYFGKVILDFRQHRVIPRRAKAFSITLLWLSIALSAYLVAIWWVCLLLLAVAVGVTIHIASFKSR